jgi:hypothetical protein
MRSRVLVRRFRGVLQLLVVVGSALLVAGCSSSTGSTPAGSSGAVSGGGKCADGTAADFCGHIKVTGGYTRDLDFHASSAFASSCADWLKGRRSDATELLLPSQSDGTIRMDAVVQHYKGPGSYSVNDLIGDLGGFQIVVEHDGFEPSASATPATTASATVNADGSGTLIAMAMQPVGDANVVQQPITAVVTWTCVMKP